ncbi:MAG: hotdog domain-containing protein, partial [Pseudomonadota bacterium]
EGFVLRPPTHRLCHREGGAPDLDHRGLHRQQIVVRSLSAEYLVPARFDDLLTVETAVVEIGRASLTVAQAVRRGAEDKPLFTATVRLAVTDAAGRPRRLPEAIAASLSSLGGGDPS